VAASPAQDLLDLADWRRRVADIYRVDGPDALAEFRQGRDMLFRTHPQSPIPEAERGSFPGLRYFPPDPRCRVRCEVRPPRSTEDLLIETGGEDGALRYRRAGTVLVRLPEGEGELTLFWLVSYSGGLFLPFRDATSGRETYGGGRYLLDTAKNTDRLALELAAGSREVVLDFNYAYNPSCAYSPRWSCPLAPRENWLPFPVRAGELDHRRPA
jgi:uncharacterized protein